MKPVDGSRIFGINGLKSYAALFIVCGHILLPDFAAWNSNAKSVPIPYDCVTLFFLISGFLTAAVSYSDKGRPSFLAFYKKKASRLLPLYYLYILISFVIYCLIGRCGEFASPGLAWYLAVQGEIPFALSKGILPIVHLWYIGVLFLYYLLAPLLFSRDAKQQLRVAIFFIIGWVVAKMGVYLVLGKCSLFRIISTMRFESLMVGSVAGILFSKYKDTVSSFFSKKPLFIISMAAFFLSGFYGDMLPAVVRHEFFAVQYSILLMCAVSERHLLLDGKFADLFGEQSYALYIVHPIILILLSVIIGNYGVPVESCFARVSFDILVIAVSYIVAFPLTKVSEHILESIWISH